jgi:hypothetical protein
MKVLRLEVENTVSFGFGFGFGGLNGFIVCEFMSSAVGFCGSGITNSGVTLTRLVLN